MSWLLFPSHDITGDYGYLCRSGCDSVDGMNDAEEFEITLAAMRSVGMKNSQIRSIFSLLAAILHLGMAPLTCV